MRTVRLPKGNGICYNPLMTAKTIARAIKVKKPAVIRENGAPRFVVLDWDTYRAWEEMREDMEDHIRFDLAMRESAGKKHYTFEEVKKKYHLP